MNAELNDFYRGGEFLLRQKTHPRPKGIGSKDGEQSGPVCPVAISEKVIGIWTWTRPKRGLLYCEMFFTTSEMEEYLRANLL